jgi:hypothetical protein
MKVATSKHFLPKPRHRFQNKNLEAMVYAFSEAMACLRSSDVMKVATFKRFLPKPRHRFQNKNMETMVYARS